MMIGRCYLPSQGREASFTTATSRTWPSIEIVRQTLERMSLNINFTCLHEGPRLGLIILYTLVQPNPPGGRDFRSSRQLEKSVAEAQTT